MAINTLHHGLTAALSQRPTEPAIDFIHDGGLQTALSYGQLDADADRAAQWFLAAGLTKGDRVVVCLDKCLAWVVAYLALQRIGGVCVPLNTGFTREEMTYFLEDIEASMAVAGPAQAKLIGAIAPELSILPIDPQAPYAAAIFGPPQAASFPPVDITSDDPALIIYTSGTTGRPKGAVLTQGNLAHDADNIVRIWEISAADVLCHALPLFHVHGLCFALHTALLSGARILMLDRFVPDTVAKVLAGGIGGTRCTVFMAVPAMYRKLLSYLEHDPTSFDHVRLWTSGSAPLLESDFHRIKHRLGQEPVEREGMSETGMNFSNPIRGVRKPGAIGLPLPGLAVRIVDPGTGEDKPAGRVGEIWLRSPSISPGYWRKPEETRKTNAGGWFHTGDLGYVDAEGYYFLTDRLKHIIISGGENISPKEIETALNSIEGVSESAVAGVADKQWGEKVVAAVVTKPGHTVTIDTIERACADRLHKWKRPKEIRFVDALPKNTMGKVLVAEVKKLFDA